MARNKIFGLTSRLLMSIVAGLLILSYLSILVNPAKVWILSLAPFNASKVRLIKCSRA